MAITKKEVKFTDRAKEVIEALESGSSREELAEKYDYSTWKSLDVYMRRKGFKYDTDKENYYVPEKETAKDPVPIEADSKVSLVISLFSEGNLKFKEIASRLGFADHRELSQFMAKKGYQWSAKDGNYRKAQKGVQEKELKSEDNLIDFPGEKPPADLNSSLLQEFLKYLPLLQKLKENEQLLAELFEKEKAQAKTIPKYAVPGESATKSVYMSQNLIQLMEEFSDIKNVSQRAIIEAALIEYLKKYGFKQELAAILNI